MSFREAVRCAMQDGRVYTAEMVLAACGHLIPLPLAMRRVRDLDRTGRRSGRPLVASIASPAMAVRTGRLQVVTTALHALVRANHLEHVERGRFRLRPGAPITEWDARSAAARRRAETA